ncbi:Protein of unknown function (DUF3040) [Saccharopolyspora erythraea NRRL 2338]|uniref:Uncharacterized protein n=2 Tax=Saccharopolyspora erythraea TaxID=1836 RepID=A4FCL5_SACEN|nr:DUF3040 domain-containing protein [Saccharopolyspora erythraea]EQD87465.1 hypothetical protein N599_04250 [Saccharopolyspora erythraea D]PFG95553.1 Protein of unknown function (DUF3040) [Saccharopolyspora erythraea NRRL 2338]QRK92171.1 DUF3040 domain-containing protein [Saccharopolyspora erythraea]CAM01790.1 hypothetical protein SACE_2497 [Saccharopolyspora erythraea NRRL 2338]
MLSWYERRRLREIEYWFEANDPGLAAYVGTAPARWPPDRWPFLTTAAIVTGVALFVLGVVLSAPVLIFTGVTLGIGGLSWRYGSRGDQGSPHEHPQMW